MEPKKTHSQKDAIIGICRQKKHTSINTQPHQDTQPEQQAAVKKKNHQDNQEERHLAKKNAELEIHTDKTPAASNS